MEEKQVSEDSIASIAQTLSERRSALALVRLLLYASAEAQELRLPNCGDLVTKAADEVTNAFGLTDEEIAGFPT